MEALQSDALLHQPARVLGQQRQHVLAKVVGRRLPAGWAQRAAAARVAPPQHSAARRQRRSTPPCCHSQHTPCVPARRSREFRPLLPAAEVCRGMHPDLRAVLPRMQSLPLPWLSRPGGGAPTCLPPPCAPSSSLPPPVSLHFALQLRAAQQRQLGVVPEEGQVLAGLQRLKVTVPAADRKEGQPD